MRHIYLDTNQIYYLRRIADEAAGSDFGDYEWAYRAFPNGPDMVRDIRALCYIAALADEWEVRISPSEASFAELCLSAGTRGRETREAWQTVMEGIDGERLEREARLPRARSCEIPSLAFVEDPDDRLILSHFAASEADVLLTSDHHILQHEAELAQLGLRVMRPSEWLDEFLAPARGSEDAVSWLERILFGVGR